MSKGQFEQNTFVWKDESIELVDQSDEDIKYKEEEQEKNKYKIDDKFKISQRFSEVPIILCVSICFLL